MKIVTIPKAWKYLLVNSVVFVNGKSLNSILQHRNIGLKEEWEFRCSEYPVLKDHSEDSTVDHHMNHWKMRSAVASSRDIDL